jgi:hypothetical protein
MNALSASSRKALQTMRGGHDRGDPCEAAAHHGFNGLDDEAAQFIADWILLSPLFQARP